MKKLLSILLGGGVLLMTGCDTVREVTINEDGSGKLTNTLDMSGIIGMAKMSGQNMDKMGDQKIDTSFTMEKIADSIDQIEPADRALIKKGTVGLKVNLEEEKFITRLEFPFADPTQINRLNKLSGKALSYTMKKRLADSGDAPPGMGEGDLPEGTIDDYYELVYSKNGVERKLNTAKYATLGEDKGMQSLKEMTGQGLPMTSVLIINLPRAAKKVEGKNAKLSEDKKKVTISEPFDEFFEDGKSLEFKIEY